MRIWRPEDSLDRRFAYFSCISNREYDKRTYDGKRLWDEVATRYGTCRKCTSGPPFVRLPGTRVEWQPGSDVVGDFAWDESGSPVLVKHAVLRELGQVFRGLTGVPVEMVQSPRLKRPSRPNKRTRPRIWLPYTGPPVCELWASKYVHPDTQHGSLTLKGPCDLCGRISYRLEGVERVESHWDPERREVVQIHYPRTPGGGLFVRASDLEGCDFFSVYEYEAIFCTDRAKEFIEQRGYTNIMFREYGEVI